VAVFLSIVASIMVLIDRNTEGTRQGSIKHVPKTRVIAPIRALNPPRQRTNLQTDCSGPTFPTFVQVHVPFSNISVIYVETAIDQLNLTYSPLLN
jgi:hypothetical protein